MVLYDRLRPSILELCRRDAERLYVGKRRAEHAVPQDRINRLLVELASQGKRVLRLRRVANLFISAAAVRKSTNWLPTAYLSRSCREPPRLYVIARPPPNSTDSSRS